jgi:hypothetical protein
MAGRDYGHRSAGWGDVLAGTAAVFGLLVSSGVGAVVVAGLLQWRPTLAPALGTGLPLAVLAIGLMLCGRVAVDIGGSRAILCVVGASMVVAGLGLLYSKSSESHGDGIEPLQVLVATLTVLLVVGATATLVSRRRRRPARQPTA